MVVLNVHEHQKSQNISCVTIATDDRCQHYWKVFIGAASILKTSIVLIVTFFHEITISYLPLGPWAPVRPTRKKMQKLK